MDLEDLNNVDLSNNPKYNSSFLGYDTNNAKWISKSISTATYLIELDRWEIKSDGSEAIKTTRGINNVIIWASANGYTEITFPRGTYLIDENNPILIKSHMTLNLNGSKLIIQNNNLENYTVILFDNVEHSRIYNGTLIGDKDSHIYIKDGIGSDTHEFGTGIKIYGNCSFISIDNIEIYNFTGDAIYCGGRFPSLPYFLRKSNAENGSYSFLDGSPIVNSNKIRFTTKIFLDDPYILDSGHWGVYGGGYGNLGSDITAEFYDVFFYKSDNTFHSYVEKVQFFDEVSSPKDAKYAKVVLYQNTIPVDSNNSLWVRVNSHPENIFLEKLDIHHCRRQGMSLSGKHIYIRDNKIHHIGGSTFLTGTDPQGGIDIEDGYDLNQHFYIERNRFYNNWGYDLVITNGKYMYIKGNRFNKVGKYVSVAINAPTDKSFFINNFLHQSNVSIAGEVIISGNHFYATSCIIGSNDIVKKYGRSIEIKDSIFHNSVLTLDQNVSYTIKVDGCKFINDQSKITTFSNLGSTLILKSNPQIIMNSSFDRDDINFTIYNLNLTNGKWLFDNLTFTNINKPLSLPSSKISNCKFFDISTISFNTSGINSNAEVEINNCHIQSKDQNNHLMLINNLKKFKMTDCYIDKKDSPIFNIQNITEQLIIKNNTIKYSSPVFSNRVVFDIKSSFSGDLILIENNIIDTPLNKTLLNNETTNNPVISIFSNQLNNINVVKSKEILIHNVINGVMDPYFHMNSEPTSGYFKQGEIIYNTDVVPGGFVGWVCTSTGYTTNKTWKPATNYTKGTIIAINNQVYQTLNSGISGLTQPIFSLDPNQVSSDNNLNWKFLGVKSKFNAFGHIQM